MSTVKSLLTADEAAARLTAVGYEVSAETLRRWARERKLPAVRKLGGGRGLRVLFRVADLDALLVPEPAERGSAA